MLSNIDFTRVMYNTILYCVRSDTNKLKEV